MASETASGTRKEIDLVFAARNSDCQFSYDCWEWMDVENMEPELNNDALLHQLGGCGRFQVALVLLVSLPYMAATFSNIFMSFGLVNPGWRCQTTNANSSNNHFNHHHYGGINTTIIDVNIRGELFNQTNPQMTIYYGDVLDNYTESCVGFNTVSCQNIEFSSEESTIVTEWGLVCDKSWISSFIITIETVGGLVGGIIGGYLGDRFGRKKALYTNTLIHGILNFLCLASTSWYVFAVVRFLAGITASVTFCIECVYRTEFASPKWRAVIPGLPLWPLSCLLFFLTTYIFKNWRYLHIFNGIFSLVSLLSALALPESIRWLIVMDKSEESLKSVAKVAKMNKVSAPNETCLALIANHRQRQNTKVANFSFINLFRKGLLLYSLVLGFGYFSCDLLYFATTFGLSAIPGDFYINGIIVFVCELPGNVTTWFVPNLLGRRLTASLSSLIMSLSLFSLVTIGQFGSDGVQEYGILAMVILARTVANVCYHTLVTSSNELFPAIARTKASGWRTIVSSLGIMISPYFIPGDGSDLFVPYLVMAVLPLIASLMFLLLPETKGKPMEDDIDDAI